MAEQVQLRRGTAAQTAVFTGADGEVTVITDDHSLTVHDGSTAGGHQVASKAYVNSVIASDISYGNVVAALGYTPYNANVNANAYTTLSAVASVGYLPSATFTGANINIALGYTPYNASNPSGYITSSGSITGSANNASYLGTVPAADYLLSNGSAANLTSFPTLNQNTTGSANNASYLGGLIATDYYTTNNPSGYITSSGSANNASYLGGVPAVDYLLTNGSAASLTSFPTLNQNTTGSANNASYLGGLPASSYLTSDVDTGYALLTGANFTGNVNTTGNITVDGNLTVLGSITGNITGTAYNNAVVYDYLGIVGDQAIYTGHTVLNANIGVPITLPLTGYSNTNYRINVTYDATGFNVGAAGYLMSNVQSSTQFTIYSSSPADTNTVFWTTFGSANA